MTENILRLTIALMSFMLGLFVGFIIWHRDTNSRTLSALQVVSIGVFFTYLLTTDLAKVQYSDVVAIGILAMTAGEPVGKALGKIAEGKTKDAPKKD